MSNFESTEVKLHQLKIRMQNLKVLLEEAALKGQHQRIKQLLADVREAEEEIAKEHGYEKDKT